MLSKGLFITLYIVVGCALLTFSYTGFYNGYLEIFLAFMVIIRSRSIHGRIFIPFLLCLLYLLLSFCYAVLLKGANVFDFLMIYKFFIYAIFFSFLINKRFLTVKQFLWFYEFLIGVFFIKYFVSLFIFKNPRPILFYENNYELMFLSLLFYMYYIVEKKVGFTHQFLLSAIFLMSGSKSGLLILLFILGIVNYQVLIKRIYIIIPTFVLLIISIVTIFKQRMGGTIDIEKIDRFKFLMVFVDEIREWSIINYLFGADRITALSAEACDKLGYYQSLFSYSGDGSCYSVIFHSYILRAIYDHGIIGLILISVFVYFVVTLSGFERKQALVVVGIALLNGLSVSSFNSVYFALGISFYLIIDRSGQRHLKEEEAQLEISG